MAESHRINGAKRWAGKTAEERRAESQVARDAHRTKAQRLRDLAAEIAALRDVPDRIAAIQAELDELLTEPIAA